MKLNVRALGIASGVVAAALSALCGLLAAASPEALKTVARYLFHTDFASLGVTVTWPGLVIGAIAWGVGTALVLAAFGWFYNRLVEGAERVPLRGRAPTAG